MKVKEPIRPEWPKIREGQVLFTYFHFAADEELTKAFLDTEGHRDRLRDRGAPLG